MSQLKMVDFFRKIPADLTEATVVRFECAIGFVRTLLAVGWRNTFNHSWRVYGDSFLSGALGLLIHNY